MSVSVERYRARVRSRRRRGVSDEGSEGVNQNVDPPVGRRRAAARRRRDAPARAEPRRRSRSGCGPGACTRRTAAFTPTDIRALSRRASGWRRSSPPATAPRWPGRARPRCIGITKRAPREIEVIVPKPATAQRGFRAAHVPQPRPARRHGRRRIPVTTVARTLVDLTDDMDADELAYRDPRGRVPAASFSLAATQAAMARANGRRNLGVLEEALAAARERERRARAAGSRSGSGGWCAAPGCPTPRSNTIVNGFEVDFYWPGLCVEIDGAGHTRARARRSTTGSATPRCARPATSSCASARTTSTCAPARS